MKRDNVVHAALGALLLASASVAADEQLARLTIDVSVEGSKTWKNGADYSNSKISEKYHLVTHLQSSGEPDSVNTKDPQFAQQQMAVAAQVQQKVREAQVRAGKSVPKAAATQEEYIAQQQQLAEEMQKGQVACAGDVNCLMQLAQEYAQKAALLSYPPTDGAAPTASLGDDDEAPEEKRYLSYYGYEGCPGEIHIVINNTSEGATAEPPPSHGNGWPIHSGKHMHLVAPVRRCRFPMRTLDRHLQAPVATAPRSLAISKSV
jgi:hypothetical protein